MCKTIKQKVKFNAPVSAIYDLLADSKRHRSFTGERASIAKKIGGRFTAYSGHLSGIVVDLARGKRIVLAWRTRKFPVGIFSMATFDLKANKGGCELVLTHRGVPKHLIPDIEKGWKRFYWTKMKEHLK